MKYVVPSSVRVRQEDFGLLFYDTRSARLTYVRSGRSLVPLPAAPGGSRQLAVAELDVRGRQAVTQLLERLHKKGLLIAAGPAE